ncbi:MAG: YaiO family outer membrane beta-barrel protein [Methylobacter sp.]|nr:YaiO family outer membrane beta-barrel protein [Methylobacter sp.]
MFLLFRKRMRYGILLLTAFQFFTPLAAADEPAPFQKSGYVQFDIGYAGLTNHFQNWFDQSLRGYAQVTPNDGINWEVTHQSHFAEQGVLGSLGYQRVFNDEWYGSISASTSSDGSFLPLYRTDANLYKKWLDRRNLVTGVGFTYSQSRLENYDRIVSLDVLYYFDAPWILELGGKIAESNPGSVASQRGFAAITYGQHKHYYLTAKYDYGTEGWQAIGATQTISSFVSHEASLNLRQWISHDFGFSLTTNYYSNPNYSRTGVIAGIFVDF